MFILSKKIFFNVYLLLRDKESQKVSRGGAEREGGTESEAGSRLRAVRADPNTGLELTSCEIGCRLRAGAEETVLFFKKNF